MSKEQGHKHKHRAVNICRPVKEQEMFTEEANQNSRLCLHGTQLGPVNVGDSSVAPSVRGAPGNGTRTYPRQAHCFVRLLLRWRPGLGIVSTAGPEKPEPFRLSPRAVIKTIQIQASPTWEIFPDFRGDRTGFKTGYQQKYQDTRLASSTTFGKIEISSVSVCLRECAQSLHWAGFYRSLSLKNQPIFQIRETEVRDPQDLREEGYSSGALPDDEDAGGLDDLELSGSGDQDGTEETRTFPAVIQPLVPINNHIPERAQPGIRVPSEVEEQEENEVIPKRASPSEVDGDISNKVSMSSTAQDSNIFERTEVLAALIVGGVVGILFAVFLILLLVYRMKKKDEGSYDLGKKPIYKKAPTNEFYA
ncbi:hypothetical protein STEG23_035444 [Scotinomys teguina]